MIESIDDHAVAQRKSENGLKMNTKKIKMMFKNDILDREIYDKVIERVQEYIY